MILNYQCPECHSIWYETLEEKTDLDTALEMKQLCPNYDADYGCEHSEYIYPKYSIEVDQSEKPKTKGSNKDAS